MALDEQITIEGAVDQNVSIAEITTLIEELGLPVESVDSFLAEKTIDELRILEGKVQTISGKIRELDLDTGKFEVLEFVVRHNYITGFLLNIKTRIMQLGGGQM
jgi:prefoldin subunit 5